jgi:hypothetical protein
VRFIEAVPILFRQLAGRHPAIGRKDNCFESATHQAFVESTGPCPDQRPWLQNSRLRPMVSASAPPIRQYMSKRYATLLGPLPLVFILTFAPESPVRAAVLINL